MISLSFILSIENSIFKTVFADGFFICRSIIKSFVAKFTTNLVLNIGQKILCLFLNKLKIISENSFSKVKLNALVVDVRLIIVANLFFVANLY